MPHCRAQYWSHTRRWLAACVAAAAVGGVQPLRAMPPDVVVSQPAVQGELITGDTPTPYRLPLVGLCDPEAEARITEKGLATAAPTDAATNTHVTTKSGRAALAYPSTSGGLTTQLLPAVQRGYNLAQRGAFYAARTEFIQVLRRVAQAKDATSGTDSYSTALATGLRAMDEADDFVPAGAQLEAELDVRKVASSHRTPVLNEQKEAVLPHEAVAMYHRFAQEHLARAALDEQAGSMALYGLGRIHARLAERRDDDVQSTRSAMTMYCAALDACPTNSLAANELGVLLCRAGHALEAIEHFTRAIDIAPSATAYHNLAVAQGKLNMHAQSAANEQESQRLAAVERGTNSMSRRAGVQWVKPEEFARVSPPAALTPSQPNVTAAPDPVAARRPHFPIHKWR